MTSSTIISDNGFSTGALERITATIDRAVTSGHVPGVVAAIGRRSGVVDIFSAGKLDYEQDAPVQADSLFRLYSQTKPMTALVTLSLCEAGEFFLDDPITKWLPEFANLRVLKSFVSEDRVRGMSDIDISTEAANRDITLFDLLTMRSGLPTLSSVPAFYAEEMAAVCQGTGFMPYDMSINKPRGSYEDLVLALAKMPLHSQPGTTWHYSYDFDVLSLLLERATGKCLNTLFTSILFEPLGMNDSSFYCSPGNINRLVTEHVRTVDNTLIARDRPEASEKMGNADVPLMSGNGIFGGILSSASDFSRFALMLANGGQFNGKRIIGRKSIELMTTNHISNLPVNITVGPGYGFGFGVAVRKSLAGSFIPGTVGSYCWGGAAGTWFFVDPIEDVWGALFIQVFGYQYSPAANLRTQFEKMIYEALE